MCAFELPFFYAGVTGVQCIVIVWAAQRIFFSVDHHHAPHRAANMKCILGDMVVVGSLARVRREVRRSRESHDYLK